MIVEQQRAGFKLLPILGVTIIVLLVNSILLGTFKRKQINSDVIEYYSFVTAVFECKDLSFTADCPKIYFANTTPQGKKVNKRSVGMALMYLPWYGLSQLHATILNEHDDGYSKRTEAWLMAGMWIYFLAGIYFLGLSLIRYFDLKKVWAGIMFLLLGTNLIWYVNGEVLFTHAVNFMWMSLLIYYTILFHENPGRFNACTIGVILGFITIIRPNNVVFSLVPILYNIHDRQSLLNKYQFVRKHMTMILLAISVGFMVLIPQFMYWKFATGRWIYYSYQGEYFFWLRPKIVDFLLSFRKGWFIYTPLMLFSILGIFSMQSVLKPIKSMVYVLIPLYVYICSCWWAWSYGGCYGMRPMIDIYPLLAFPLISIFNLNKWMRFLVIIPFGVACIGLNYFQAWQYSKGILHYDQMNYNVYKSIWLKTKYPNDYDLMISYPDYKKEARGEGPYYEPMDITNGMATVKFIRSGYVESDTLSGILSTECKEVHKNGVVRFVYDASAETYLLKFESTGCFVTVNRESKVLEAKQLDVLSADGFKINFLGGNKFALETTDKLFVSASEGSGFKLTADSKKLNPTSIFVLTVYPSP